MSLQRGGAHFCSGVTISERYILTAGHCIAGALGYPTRTSGSIGSLQVVYSPDGVTKTTVYSGGASAMISPNYILQKAYPCSFSEHDRAVIQLGGDASQWRKA